MPPVEGSALRAVAARVAGPAALAAGFVGLAAWSWGRWTDVHIDFGSELYVAWRLAEGDVLYRDVAHRDGPLSPALNALWFRGFGVSLRTLVFANLAVLAAITALAYRLLASWAGLLAATAACGFFLAVFGFSQYGPIANFNYVTPYDHAQTHGLLLALAMLSALDASFRAAGVARRRGWSAAAGACLGALFLTKVELFVPALAVAACAGGWRILDRRGARVPAGEGGAFVLGSLAPVAVAAGVLLAWLPPAEALGGVLGNWRYLGTVAGDPFYAARIGWTDLGDHLARAGRALALGGLAVAASAALDRALPRLGGGAAAAVGLGLAAALAAAPAGWGAELARALPVAALAGVALGVTLAVRRPDWRDRLFAPTLLAVLALGLLGKILLAVGFGHYGFALAAPAAWLAVAAWVGGLPAWLRLHGGGGYGARAVALALCFGVALAQWRDSDRRYAPKDLPVGAGADRIWAEGPAATPRPALVERTRAWLAARAEPSETLLVLPEGVILNYWLRMRNPTPYYLFLPTELTAFGETAVLRELARRPADWVVLAHRSGLEFGVGPFGRDPRNGRALVAWVRSHYRRVERFGAEPFRGEGFGVSVWRRSEAPP